MFPVHFILKSVWRQKPKSNGMFVDVTEVLLFEEEEFVEPVVVIWPWTVPYI
jgi:hypothetical protein